MNIPATRTIHACAALRTSGVSDVRASQVILSPAALQTDGLLEPRPSRPLAVLLMGAASEAVAVIGNAEDAQRARAELGEAARWLAGRLLRDR